MKRVELCSKPSDNYIDYCFSIFLFENRFVLSVDPARLVLPMSPPWLMKLLSCIRLEQFFLVVLHLLRYFSLKSCQELTARMPFLLK